MFGTEETIQELFPRSKKARNLFYGAKSLWSYNVQESTQKSIHYVALSTCR